VPKARIAVVAVAVAALVGVVIWAAADNGGSSGGDATLADTSWTLTNLGDTALAPNATATLDFTTTDASGSGGCNTFHGTYTADDGSISFGPLASTMMACEGPVMAQEQVYLAALGAAETYTIEGDTLTLSWPTGSITLARA
jgi:heat shock protein HslJ